MPNNLQDLLNPDFINHLVQQSQNPQNPQSSPVQQHQNYNEYGVPIVYTEPDVVLQGRLRFEARFKHTDIAGKTADQLTQLAYSVVMGNRGPGLPEITPGLLELYQEVQKPYAAATPQQNQYDPAIAQRIIGEYLAELGRSGVSPNPVPVPGIGEAGHRGGTGDSPDGGPANDADRGSGPVDDSVIRDSDDGPGTTPDDRRQNVGTTTHIAGKSRTRRSGRTASDDPIIPQSELIYDGNGDDSTE